MIKQIIHFSYLYCMSYTVCNVCISLKKMPNTQCVVSFVFEFCMAIYFIYCAISQNIYMWNNLNGNRRQIPKLHSLHVYLKKCAQRQVLGRQKYFLNQTVFYMIMLTKSVVPQASSFNQIKTTNIYFFSDRKSINLHLIQRLVQKKNISLTRESYVINISIVDE